MNTIRTALSLFLVVASSGHLVSGQFLPQSHLGRLVQSITSPLMIAPSAYRETAEAEAPYPDPSSYYPQAGVPQTHHQMPAAHGLGQIQPEASRHEHQTGRRLHMLQQSPSQQRGIPQQYYGQPMNEQQANGGPADQEDRDQGAAPSTNKHRNPEYQMGAYLGPTIDDKEINGAFNSNNDDRDEDDGPSSYDGPTNGKASGGRNKAASSAYHSDLAGYGADEANYGQQPSSVDNGAYSAGRHRPGSPDPVSSYDEDGADEDEASAGPRSTGGRQSGRAGLSRAASHYQQQGSYGGQAAQAQRGPMVAAANGYAPFGYAAGPVDLSGLMAGVSGDPSAGYQVYGGDASYPGANYYQQQGQRGARNQAASMSNYNMNDGYGPNPMLQGHLGGQRANGDNDDGENEADDD